MPDAVKKFIETKDIREVDKIQQDIVELYKEDFSKYDHVKITAQSGRIMGGYFYVHYDKMQILPPLRW